MSTKRVGKNLVTLSIYSRYLIIDSFQKLDTIGMVGVVLIWINAIYNLYILFASWVFLQIHFSSAGIAKGPTFLFNFVRLFTGNMYLVSLCLLFDQTHENGSVDYLTLSGQRSGLYSAD
jgi:hypothetical protein